MVIAFFPKGNDQGQNEVMPEPGTKLKFSNFNRKFSTNIFGVIDFETALIKNEEDDSAVMKPVQFGVVFGRYIFCICIFPFNNNFGLYLHSG